VSSDEDLLVQQNPLPAALPNRLADQLAFIIEVDRLKTVLRASPLAAAERRENDAEHSWHLALMVMLLSDYSDERIDVGHTMRLVVIHDLVEIYAGDTPLYDTAAAADQQQREEAAADRLFRLLPVDQAQWVRALWDEFEARRTPEARFAKAIDRLEPILLNWMAKGGTWDWPGVTADVVRARTAGIKDGSRQLWDAVHSMIEEGVRSGWIRPPA
jgi:putative hydrolase of HD superfamily